MEKPQNAPIRPTLPYSYLFIIIYLHQGGEAPPSSSGIHHHRPRGVRSKIYLETQKNGTFRSNLQKAALLCRDQGSPLSAHINFMAEKCVSSKVPLVPMGRVW